MNIISQHVKGIMEECKKHATDAGLKFDDESLEYIVTNQDMLELSPKHMIPTLYDYWVQDVETLIAKGNYKLYPSNPYETVINTRPAVSFYNDNNPDWLNVMIFYHVLGHIDMFQNNTFFKHTWNDDFLGKARADKRLVNRLRSEHGRWVDYVIEFTRGIDNITGYYRELSFFNQGLESVYSDRLNYYFDIFLQNIKHVPHHEYLKNMEKYNEYIKNNRELGESLFFSEIKTQYPEFESLFDQSGTEPGKNPKDLMEYLLYNSPFLNRDENMWMKSVIHIVRDTSLYFEPQRRTQILNEGWASFWHERLFLNDKRIAGHEVDFAKVHAKVTSLQRVGLNPYAIGMRLFEYIEIIAAKGSHSYEFQKTYNIERRKQFNKKNQKATDFLFKVREEHCDFTLINTYLDQDFVNRYKLFTVERRLNEQRRSWEYIVKSRKSKDYRQMLTDTLWHPPNIIVDEEKTDEGKLYLYHVDEEKPLVSEYINNTMIGIEYLWGGEVNLETSDIYLEAGKEEKPKVIKERKLYTMKNTKLRIRTL